MGRMKEAAATGTYPGSPGWKEPTTSREAAERIASTAANVRHLVMGCVINHPAGMTADEIAVYLGIDKLTVRPRLSELRAEGRIEPTGMRRKNASGHSAMTWRATPTWGRRQ
jgi:predicted ArsR family transcriptional regulator